MDFRVLLLLYKSLNGSTPEHIDDAEVIYEAGGAEIKPDFRLNMVKQHFAAHEWTKPANRRVEPRSFTTGLDFSHALIHRNK